MEKYEEILNTLNIPLIQEENIILSKHKIFQKYTSKPYYKYAFDLLETLSLKTNYDNKKQIIHNSFTYLTIILYNCENVPYLSNFDLMILCCFYLSVKAIVKQNTIPTMNKLKKIYSEKFINYKTDEIRKGEVICIKLLKYKINVLTIYDCLYFLLNQNKNLFHLVLDKFEKEKLLNIMEYVNKKPFDLAKEIIHLMDTKVKLKYPKIIKKKFIQNYTHININKPKYSHDTNRVQIPNFNKGLISHNNINSKNLLYNKYSTIINSSKPEISLLLAKTSKHYSIYKKKSSKKNKTKSKALNSSNLLNSFSNMDIEISSSPFNNTNCSSSPCGSDGLPSFLHQNSSGVKIIDKTQIEIFKKPCLDKKNMKTSFNFNKKNFVERKTNLELSRDTILEKSSFDQIKDYYLSGSFYTKRKMITGYKNKFINYQS